LELSKVPSNGSGVYSLPATYIAVTGDLITAAQHNDPLEDIAQGLTDRLMRSGVAPMTGNLAMGANKVTGLAAGTVSTDAVNKTQLDAVQTELDDRALTPQVFGAVADGVTDDTDAIQDAIDYGAANGIKVRLTAGTYKITSQLTTKANLHLEFDNGAWLKPTAWSATGSVLTNVHPTDDAARIQDNILIVNPQMDGSDLPYDGLGNDNAIGFARGASNVRIVGGLIKDFAFSWTAGGAGGKAVNLEGGVTDAIVTGVKAQDCGIGVFVQGYDGTWTSGAAKRTSRIIVSDIVAVRCEAAIALLGINTAADPDGDADDMLVVIDGVTFYNCGHAPNRPATSDFQKSGAIVLGEAQNVRIDNVKGYNASTYPASWPAAAAGVVGEGLSGPIGAVIWGWGRNITIGSVEYHGACDSLVRINRARALGEDAAASAQPQNCFRFDVDNIRHFGTCSTVLALDSNAAARVQTTELTGIIRATTDTVSTGLMASTLNGYSGVYAEITDGSTGKVVRGTATGIYNNMNAFSSARGQENDTADIYAKTQIVDRLYGASYTMADDTAVSFTPIATAGVIVISSESSLLRALVSYRADATPQVVNMGNAIANFAVTTGVLAGTTGTDTNFTVSAHTDGKIYLENRRGGSVTVTVTLLG
jgi:hypothetical protein